MPAQSASKARVVVLDDEPNMGKILSKVLRLEGFDVSAFEVPSQALAHLETHGADVLLTDLRMPGMTGEEMLQAVRERALPVEVILMTAYGTVESAMRCVRQGAYDYVTKPFETKALVAAVKKAAAKRHRTPLAPPLETPGDLIGSSPAMDAVRELIRKVAPADSPVLITGESGTGKELAARAIHLLSPRASFRFVAINCASIPENLMESELFGHERGAFTGANEARAGLMEAAEGGTLFLDEIGDMPLGLQVKLLRALQEREITRVGSVHPVAVDFRLVAATNRQLDKAVAAGNFREDLFYRLNVLQVHMPTLRQRRDDIPVLAERFLDEFRQDAGKPGLKLSDAVVKRLSAMDWPGNVRELRNFMERLAVLCENPTITEQDIFDIGNYTGAVSGNAAPAAEYGGGEIAEFRQARDRFEADYLKAVLKACSGNVTEAAKKSGISRRNFYEKIEKLNIDPGAFK